MNICILGTGAYAVALALKFNKNKYNIKMWTKFEDEQNFILKNKYSKSLPEIYLPNNVEVTCDMEKAVTNSDVIVIAVPIEALDETMKNFKNYFTNNMYICIATKGIEKDTFLFSSQIVEKYINTNNICVISGPTFAIDMANDKIAGLSVATTSIAVKNIILSLLKTNDLDISFTTDIIGVQICGTIKNILAVASGMLIGLGMAESTLATFITKSLFDINKIIIDLGGEQRTVFSYAGVGDILLTCTTTKSRNFTLGNLIGSSSNEEIINDYIKNNTVEGLYSLDGFYNLLNNNKINNYLINLIYDIIYNKKDVKSILNYIVGQ